MIKHIIWRCGSSILVAALIVLTACASTQKADTQPAKPAQEQGLKLLNIVGIQEVKPGTENMLTCGVAGNDDSNLIYAWSVDQGAIKGEGKQVTWVSPGTPGDYAVTVTVSDSKGNQGTVSRTFKVTTNPFNNDTPDPTIYLKFNLPQDKGPSESRRLKIWTPSEIECIVADRDPGQLNYKWTVPGGKLLGDGIAEGTAHRVGWIAPGQAGLYKVTVEVTDNSGNKSTGEVNFDIYCCHE